jgi:hypothetical protein
VNGNVQISVPASESWEEVATFVVAQSLGNTLALEIDSGTVLLHALLHYADPPVPWSMPRGFTDAPYDFSRAYRLVDDPLRLSDLRRGDQVSYFDILRDLVCATNGDRAVIGPPRLIVPKGNTGGIVLCPFAPKPVLAFPDDAWRHVAKLLRTFDRNVSLLGDFGQRMDDSLFSESDIASDASNTEKIALLRNASLVIGVPNAWTWIAAGMRKPAVLVYAADVPQFRWYPESFEHNRLRRIHTSNKQLSVPLLLAGLRKVINSL